MSPEFRQLAARTDWLQPWVQRAIAWALRGPSWVPVRVRRLPLGVVLTAARVELWRLRHGL
jgi:hypothetical protein